MSMFRMMFKFKFPARKEGAGVGRLERGRCVRLRRARSTVRRGGRRHSPPGESETDNRTAGGCAWVGVTKVPTDKNTPLGGPARELFLQFTDKGTWAIPGRSWPMETAPLNHCKEETTVGAAMV